MGLNTDWFEPKPDAAFICSICHEVFEDPVEFPICQHAFCRVCIMDWMVTSKTCPLDRKSVKIEQLRQPHRYVLANYQQLKLRCPEKGVCTSYVSLGDIEKHKLECPERQRKVLRDWQAYVGEARLLAVEGATCLERQKQKWHLAKGIFEQTVQEFHEKLQEAKQNLMLQITKADAEFKEEVVDFVGSCNELVIPKESALKEEIFKKEKAGYELSRFPSTPPNHFICQICHHVLKDPVELKCQHLYCRACIKPLDGKVKFRCPKENVGVWSDLRQPHRTFKEDYGKLIIKCDEGFCELTVCLEFLEEHKRADCVGYRDRQHMEELKDEISKLKNKAKHQKEELERMAKALNEAQRQRSNLKDKLTKDVEGLLEGLGAQVKSFGLSKIDEPPQTKPLNQRRKPSWS